jgi:hypothetical protein
MPIIVYDNRDHPSDRYRDVTFRWFASDGRLLARGTIVDCDPRLFATHLADVTGEALEYIGPQPCPEIEASAAVNSGTKSQRGLF